MHIDIYNANILIFNLRTTLQQTGTATYLASSYFRLPSQLHNVHLKIWMWKLWILPEQWNINWKHYGCSNIFMILVCVLFLVPASGTIEPWYIDMYSDDGITTLYLGSIVYLHCRNVYRAVLYGNGDMVCIVELIIEYIMLGCKAVCCFKGKLITTHRHRTSAYLATKPSLLGTIQKLLVGEGGWFLARCPDLAIRQRGILSFFWGGEGVSSFCQLLMITKPKIAQIRPYSTHRGVFEKYI